MANGANRPSPEERMVNLVVALMATEIGLTKEQILSSVAGYREQLDEGVSKDALDRLFERDKEALRGLGVPVQMVGDHTDPNDLREARYRIPAEDYSLPEHIAFSPAELALLELAGSVWAESSMSEGARTGVRKLRSFGIDHVEPIVGYAPRILVRDAAFTPLQQAIERAAVVTFDYLTPGDAHPRRRRVQPLALVEYEGRWHLYAQDMDADAPRTYLLSRITTAVSRTRLTGDPALREGAGERARTGLEALAARQRALVEIHPGTEAAARLARRITPAPQGYWLPYVDAHVAASELASYGPEVRVVEPASLRQLVIDLLRAALDRHQEPA